MNDVLACGCINGYHTCEEAVRLWNEFIAAKIDRDEDKVEMVKQDYIRHVSGFDRPQHTRFADSDDVGIPDVKKRCWLCNGSHCDTFIWTTILMPDDAELCAEKLAPVHEECYTNWDE